jgi:3'-phosphoadenosine 5'-phosphosulfate sulfotransferase
MRWVPHHSDVRTSRVKRPQACVKFDHARSKLRMAWRATRALAKEFSVLALESSADDTCAAIVTSTRKILSNVVIKQNSMSVGSTSRVIFKHLIDIFALLDTRYRAVFTPSMQ